MLFGVDARHRTAVGFRPTTQRPRPKLNYELTRTRSPVDHAGLNGLSDDRHAKHSAVTAGDVGRPIIDEQVGAPSPNEIAITGRSRDSATRTQDEQQRH
jgi:hypothetical protein